MVAAIIILGALLLAETLFIFWLLKVLKNTLEITTDAMDLVHGRTPKKIKEAYDGKYYPATVIATTVFGSPQEMTVTDFSRYEDLKIVGFTICTTKSIREYYEAEHDDISDEELEEIFNNKPVVFNNVLVYAPWEGMWTWKSADS